MRDESTHNELPIVQIDNLSHRYGDEWAIRHVTFSFDRYGVVGLLGANGAGKSTLMNTLCGVLSQTEGTVRISGIETRECPLDVRRRVGFLPQRAPLHLEVTVDEYLRHCAVLRQLEGNEIRAALQLAKEKCGLAAVGGRLIGNLSGGYRQRVGIAQAIIHQPELVVLDEPMNGLDPNQITAVRKLIAEIGKERSVLLSSHILEDVRAVCDRIVMLDEGKMVFDGNLDQFGEYIAPSSLVITCRNLPTADEVLALDGVRAIDPIDNKKMRVVFEGTQDIAERIVVHSVSNHWRLEEIQFERNSLEYTFAYLSSKGPSKSNE